MEAENELLKRAAEGDKFAFEAFIRPYEKLIFNVAMKMMGNIELAQDMAQESMIKIYRNIHKCQNFAIKSWMCTITTNTCLDEIRKRKGKRTESLDEVMQCEDGEITRQFVSNEPTPEQRVLSAARVEAINESLMKLSPEHRRLIILRDVQGLSYQEISDITETPLGTVKSGISRARISLKKILKNLIDKHEY